MRKGFIVLALAGVVLTGCVSHRDFGLEAAAFCRQAGIAQDDPRYVTCITGVGTALVKNASVRAWAADAQSY